VGALLVTRPQGAVVWITGLPGAGKSTFAARLRDACAASGRACALLDGDEVRAALVPSPGYGEADRERFQATLASLAALLARQGLVVAVAATTHRRAWRERARRMAPRFVEVWVATGATECARRDPKGLWACARAGEVAGLPGAGEEYEPPVAQEVRAEGGEDAAALRRALDLVVASGPDAG
jgi:adenylylsulfate kinase